MESSSKALASSATQASADLDSVYATLFFDEISSDVFENDCMTDMVEVHVIEDDAIGENVILKEVLENLAKQLSSDKISVFNLSRNHVWEGTKRALNRKSFNPQNKLSVKFTDDIGQSEGAVDMGGPAREFFTIITEWLLGSQLFFGEPTSKFLSLNATSLEEREYFMAGQIFAMSLVHGGPGINCLSDTCYDAIVKDSGTINLTAKLEEIADVELRSSLSKLLESPSVSDAQEIIRAEKLDTIFDMAGAIKVMKTKADVDKVVQLTINWHVLGRCESSYNSFKEGLQALGVLEAIVAHPKLLKDVFCYKAQCLTAVLMESIFKVSNRAEEGSNRRNGESLVLSYWNDVLQGAEEDSTEISLAEILFFASGCKSLPPLGIRGEVQFLHDVEKDGSLSRLPKANTCACIIKLPVVHNDYNSFKDAMIFGIKNARGFGCP